MGVQRHLQLRAPADDEGGVHPNRHRRPARLAGVLHLRRRPEHEGARDARDDARERCSSLSRSRTCSRCGRQGRSSSTSVSLPTSRAPTSTGASTSASAAATRPGRARSSTLRREIVDHRRAWPRGGGGNPSRPDRLRPGRRLPRGWDGRARRSARPRRPHRARHGADPCGSARVRARRRSSSTSAPRASGPRVASRGASTCRSTTFRSGSTRFRATGPSSSTALPTYRATIAASLLELDGFADISTLVGGIGAWEASRLATSASA